MYAVCLFRLATFAIFILALVFCNFFPFDEPWGCFLPVYLNWYLLSFLDLWVCSFHQIWKNSGLYVFKYFYSPPLFFPGTPNLLDFDIFPQVSDTLLFCFFFSVFLPFHASFWIASLAMFSIHWLFLQYFPI